MTYEQETEQQRIEDEADDPGREQRDAEERANQCWIRGEISDQEYEAAIEEARS